MVGAEKARKVSHELSLIEVNCEEFKIRDLRIWLYDDGENSVYEFPTNFLRKWTDSPRQSNDGRTIEAVCMASSKE